MVRAISTGLLASTLLLPAACGSSQEPDWVSRQAEGCGVTVLDQPACEAAVDRECCAHQVACADDPACAKVAACWQYCIANRHSQGCGCTNNCAPQGAATPGLQKFLAIANCSKWVDYPDGLDCGGC